MGQRQKLRVEWLQEGRVWSGSYGGYEFLIVPRSPVGSRGYVLHAGRHGEVPKVVWDAAPSLSEAIRRAEQTLDEAEDWGLRYWWVGVLIFLGLNVLIGWLR